jgi:hypothetical protein
MGLPIWVKGSGEAYFIDACGNSYLSLCLRSLSIRVISSNSNLQPWGHMTNVCTLGQYEEEHDWISYQ